MEFGFIRPATFGPGCMNSPPDRDKLIMQLCDRLVGLDVHERRAFLDANCASDLKLRRDVEELLYSIDSSGEFLCLNDKQTEV